MLLLSLCSRWTPDFVQACLKCYFYFYAIRILTSLLPGDKKWASGWRAADVWWPDRSELWRGADQARRPGEVWCSCSWNTGSLHWDDWGQEDLCGENGRDQWACGSQWSSSFCGSGKETAPMLMIVFWLHYTYVSKVLALVLFSSPIFDV